ncbi:MAG: hypothetical protein K0V04_03350 [Deltaproteobacteria bacterium]|nr:hypothetical protein [Deltaproteobacteria bacterium]
MTSPIADLRAKPTPGTPECSGVVVGSSGPDTVCIAIGSLVLTVPRTEVASISTSIEAVDGQAVHRATLQTPFQWLEVRSRDDARPPQASLVQPFAWRTRSRLEAPTDSAPVHIAPATASPDDLTAMGAPADATVLLVAADEFFCVAVVAKPSPHATAAGVQTPLTADLAGRHLPTVCYGLIRGDRPDAQAFGARASFPLRTRPRLPEFETTTLEAAARRFVEARASARGLTHRD